jgi:hypothetical protein
MLANTSRCLQAWSLPDLRASSVAQFAVCTGARVTSFSGTVADASPPAARFARESDLGHGVPRRHVAVKAPLEERMSQRVHGKSVD